ncbi:MAG TPA: SufS family cysteine desulfurase [Patescibacteria group bacterium]|nr:SufS family cysteine desulfurase [Patescibacteria group bacterium]
MLNPDRVKKDFPILSRVIHENKRLVYLDSAATSQKPMAVLTAIQDYYLHHTANVHRGIHVLGDESTKMFYAARANIAAFFGADADELILMRNTTEALNGFIYMWAERHVGKGDVVVSSGMEHHSNFVPWQLLAKRKGCTFEVIPVTETGELDLKYLQKLLDGGKVKVVAFVHVSNATGTNNPVENIVKMAKKAGVITVVDGAQSAPHMPINFHALGCDVYAFSGHKMVGPMGIGGLIVRKELLKDMEPFLFGGGMINEVSLEETTFADVPDKFIAGTPDVASAVGLAAACDYLTSLDMKHVFAHDAMLVKYALEKLQNVEHVTVIGPTDASKRCGSVAFVYNSVHAHDVAQILDSEGIAVRSGHHCTMPLHKRFGWAATTRASFNVYTTKEDIDALVLALQKVKEVFKK